MATTKELENRVKFLELKQEELLTTNNKSEQKIATLSDKVSRLRDLVNDCEVALGSLVKMVAKK